MTPTLCDSSRVQPDGERFACVGFFYTNRRELREAALSTFVLSHKLLFFIIYKFQACFLLQELRHGERRSRKASSIPVLS